MKLCMCNNCETVMFDENPTESGFDFSEEDIKTYQPEQMAYLKDHTGFYWGCPKCKTDGYLTDLTTREMLTD